MNDVDQQKCEWPKCSQVAATEVHYEYEKIHVCRAHRQAVVVNIELYGRIWIFQRQEQERKEQRIVRPGEEKPRYKGTVPARKPAQQPAPVDPQQEAAKRADAAATPVQGAPTLVQPSKRRPGGQALSRALGRATGEE